MNPVLEMFQSFRTILCICPKCNQMSRLSDLHLRLKAPAKKTWLDEYETKLLGVQTKEEKFDEKEKKLRDLAAERGRKAVPKIIEKAMNSELVKLKINPYDIKAILHPIDFIVFSGMNDKDTVSDIMLLSKKCNNSDLTMCRDSIKGVISKGNYDWKVARVDTNGRIQFTEK
jgi:predicted Holliday junction resolvase-like endonuclease